MKVLDEYVRKVTVNDAIILEEHIKILLQPKPRWLPTFVWHKLLSRLLVIQRS